MRIVSFYKSIYAVNLFVSATSEKRRDT